MPIYVIDRQVSLVEVDPNLIVNGDFRYETVSGYPDGWDRYLAPKELLDMWWEAPCIEIVDDNPGHGCQKSLKIVVDSTTVGKVYVEARAISFLLSYLSLRSNMYFDDLFLSFFCKTGESSKQLQVYWAGETYDFDVSDTWQKFTIRGGRNFVDNQSLKFIPLSEGTFYLSGIQITKTSTQEYEDSPFITRVINIPEPRTRNDFREYLLSHYGVDYGNIPIANEQPPDKQVTVDPVRRCIFVNGNPYFYFGACFMRVHYHEDNWDFLLNELSQKGYTAVIATFTTYWNDDKATDEQVVNFFDLANSYGLKVIVWISPCAVRQNGSFVKVKDLSPEEQVSHYSADIDWLYDIIGNHSALLGWYVYDEPRQDFIEVGALDEIINYAYEIDSEHIVEVNFGGDNAWYYYEQHGNNPIPVDIISQTSYPIPRYTIQTCAEDIAQCYVTGGYRRMSTIWMQFWSGYGRYPTPDEFSCIAYLAAIYGATGFQTWPIMPSAKSLWDRAKIVISEMKQLEDWLYQSQRLNASIDNQYIDFALKQVGSDYILVTVNFSDQTQDAVITLDDVPSVSGIEDFFTGDPVSFSGNTIATSYLPYERKVFKIIP